MPNQFAGDLLHTMACYELSRVRTELYNLFVILFLAPHPEQTDGEFACHGYLGDPGTCFAHFMDKVAKVLCS